MKIFCDSCGKRFETEDTDWRTFINEAKADGWIMVKDVEWYRYCSIVCKEEAEE